VSCAEIKPLQIPPYNPPDLSHVKRPEIPVPQEGKDYFIDAEKGTVTYTISGQNLLTSKVISEKAAWQAVEMLKQMLDIQGQIIVQKDQLVVAIDLKRQYAEREKIYGDLEAYASWLITLISWFLIIVK
jgi:hypothetical protein